MFPFYSFLPLSSCGLKQQVSGNSVMTVNRVLKYSYHMSNFVVRLFVLCRQERSSLHQHKSPLEDVSNSKNFVARIRAVRVLRSVLVSKSKSLKLSQSLSHFVSQSSPFSLNFLWSLSYLLHMLYKRGNQSTCPETYLQHWDPSSLHVSQNQLLLF